MAKGVVKQLPEHYRVEFAYQGASLGLERVWTEEEGRIICDLLAIKEAVDAGRPLDSLSLHTADELPSTRLTESAASLVRSVAFGGVMDQLERVAEGTTGLEDDYLGASHLDALGIAAHKLLCVASYLQQLCAVQLLLLLHPATASQSDAWDWFATHSAAVGGSVPVLRLLLAAAPATALAHDRVDKHTPLDKALQRQNSEAASYLLTVVPAQHGLSSLVQFQQNSRDAAFLHSLFVELVIAHCPLPADLWQQLPVPCPGLAHALPAALHHLHAQACMLMQHLPPTDAAVLRTALLCLARQQRSCNVSLPPPLIERILCMAVV